MLLCVFGKIIMIPNILRIFLYSFLIQGLYAYAESSQLTLVMQDLEVQYKRIPSVLEHLASLNSQVSPTDKNYIFINGIEISPLPNPWNHSTQAYFKNTRSLLSTFIPILQKIGDVGVISESTTCASIATSLEITLTSTLPEYESQFNTIDMIIMDAILDLTKTALDHLEQVSYNPTINQT
jgi:hypothetical protein